MAAEETIDPNIVTGMLPPTRIGAAATLVSNSLTRRPGATIWRTAPISDTMVALRCWSQNQS